MTIAEGQLSECEQENARLRSQLAQKERAIQRLLVIEQEQAAEIEQLQQQRAEQMLRIAELQALVAAVEEAANV